MGWLFTEGQTRSELIRHRIEPWANDDHYGAKLMGTCLTHTLRGNVLWTVWEIQKNGVPTDRYIGCDLLQGQRNFGWGYKDMEESVGVYYYTCPEKYLDMVPFPPNEWGRAWREKVHAYHVKRRERLAKRRA